MKNLFAVLALGWVMASCAPSTPQARIQQSPQKYDALTAKDRELVGKGLISRGMSPDAVYLAWGKPSRVFQGSKHGKNAERWDYAGSRPVYGSSFYGAYGYGYGPYGPYGRYGYYGLGPDVAYVPYRIASVWFVNQKVDSWERVR